MSDSKDSLTLKDLIKIGDNLESLDYWTLSFSPKQQCFHTERLSIMLNENVDQLIKNEGQCADFIIVGLAKNLGDLKAMKGKLETSWKKKLDFLANEESKPVKTSEEIAVEEYWNNLEDPLDTNSETDEDAWDRHYGDRGI